MHDLEYAKQLLQYAIQVQHLADAINLWVEHWNTNPTPFTWTARPEDILPKIERARAALTNSKANSVSDH